MFLKDRQVSSFGYFVFEFWVLRYRYLRASFSRFGCWVLSASFFGLRFRVLRFRNYRIRPFRERLSDKVHATTPKGIVGGFEFTVFQRNLKECYWRPRTYVCEC